MKESVGAAAKAAGSWWPRGRYNGQRIVGVEVKVRFDVLWWSLGLPTLHGRCMSIGPFHIWLSLSYEHRFRAPLPSDQQS